MAFVIGTIDRICFVHWTATPDVAEARTAFEFVVQARRDAGHPLVLFAVLDANVRIPDPSTANEMARWTGVLDHLSESHQIVTLGDDQDGTLQRGLITALTAVVSSPVTITRSVDAALESVCHRFELDVRELTAEARARRLIPG